MHPAHAHVGRPERYTADQSAFPGIKEQGLKTFHGHLKQIDGMLAGREWLGDNYSVLDPYGFVFYTWGVRRELPMAELKNYTAFKDRMKKRPAVGARAGGREDQGVSDVVTGAAARVANRDASRDPALESVMPVIDCHHHVWWVQQTPAPVSAVLGHEPQPRLHAGRLSGRSCAPPASTAPSWCSRSTSTTRRCNTSTSPTPRISSAQWSAGCRWPIPPACEKALASLRARRKFVGVRHLIDFEPDPSWLLQPGVQASLDMLRRAGLVLEVIPNTEPQMASVLEAARRMPDLAVVLNHLGRPPVPESGWEPWASQIVQAAALPNISVKLSVGGDVVSRWKWSTEQIRRYAEHALAHFGADRVMAASNWPVVLLSGGFQQVWNGIGDLCAGLTARERAAVLGDTADAYLQALSNVPARPPVRPRT